MKIGKHLGYMTATSKIMTFEMSKLDSLEVYDKLVSAWIMLKMCNWELSS